MLIMLIGAAAMPTVVNGVVVTGPTSVGDVPSWISSDDYPLAAIEAGEEGTVSVRLIVDKTGKLSGCTIKKSSGSAVLDEATCAVLSRNARFRPVVNSRGQPVQGVFQRAVVWKLPRGDGTPYMSANWRSDMTLTVQPDGTVSSCQSTDSTGTAYIKGADGSKKSFCETYGDQYGGKRYTDEVGKPTAVTITVVHEIKVQPVKP
jgi:TonB family protein